MDRVSGRRNGKTQPPGRELGVHTKMLMFQGEVKRFGCCGRAQEHMSDAQRMSRSRAGVALLTAFGAPVCPVRALLARCFKKLLLRLSLLLSNTFSRNFW